MSVVTDKESDVLTQDFVQFLADFYADLWKQLAPGSFPHRKSHVTEKLSTVIKHTMTANYEQSDTVHYRT